MKPIRVQRKRIKGWRMPENTVCIHRGTVYGNPFKVGETYRIHYLNGKINWSEDLPGVRGQLVLVRDNQHAVNLFERYAKDYPFPTIQIERLKKRNVACFCRLDQPCHGDVLLKLANPETDE